MRQVGGEPAAWQCSCLHVRTCRCTSRWHRVRLISAASLVQVAHVRGQHAPTSVLPKAPFPGVQAGLIARLCGHGKPDICFVFVSSRRQAVFFAAPIGPACAAMARWLCGSGRVKRRRARRHDQQPPTCSPARPRAKLVPFPARMVSAHCTRMG